MIDPLTPKDRILAVTLVSLIILAIFLLLKFG
jgi:hypothetical protein